MSFFVGISFEAEAPLPRERLVEVAARHAPFKARELTLYESRGGRYRAVERAPLRAA